MLARLWLKTRDNLDLNVLLGVALNVLHKAFLIHANQIDCSTVSTCASGAANAVHVVFAHVGNFIVHDMGQVINVNAACCDVGRHQSADVTALEARQCLGAGSLTFVAMQRHGLNAVFGQKLSDIVGTKLGAGEHQHLAPVLLLNDMGEQCLLLAAPYRVNHLGNALHGGVAWRDLHALGVLEQGGRQITDFIAESGRKEQALFVLGHCSEHLLYVMDETHVQHAVGFVQHQHLDLAQVQHTLLQQVQQATRSGNQDVNAFFDTADLRVHADAAKYDGARELNKFPVDAHRFFHLCRQLACRREHQRTNAFAAEFVLHALANA